MRIQYRRLVPYGVERSARYGKDRLYCMCMHSKMICNIFFFCLVCWTLEIKQEKKGNKNHTTYIVACIYTLQIVFDVFYFPLWNVFACICQEAFGILYQ